MGHNIGLDKGSDGVQVDSVFNFMHALGLKGHDVPAGTWNSVNIEGNGIELVVSSCG